MKLRNKQTGEIGWLYCDHISVPKKMTVFSEDKDLSANHWDYKSLTELNEEWEDAPEEPFSTPFYTIVDGEIKHCIFYRERIAGCPSDAWAYLKDDGRKSIEQLKGVGLYFETREEAELAVRKLKAWKRLKDKGFEFINFPYKKICKYDARTGVGNLEYQVKYYEELEPDLDICFGGEDA